MHRKSQGFLILTAATVLLGSSFIAGKSMVTVIPIPVAMTVRLIMSTTIMVPLLLRQERRTLRLNKRCWCLLLLEAAIGVVAFNYLVFSAYDYVSAASVSIVFSALPIFIAAMSAFFLSEKLPRTAIVAVVLAAYGIAQLNQSEMSLAWFGEVTAVGVVLCLGAVLCEGAFTVVAKALAREMSPLAIAALVSLISLVIMIPVWVFETDDFDPNVVATTDWVALAWWAIASGIGYFWLWFVGVARVEAHAAGVVTVALPLSTMLMSAMVLHEEITTAHLVGAGCAIAAVILISAPWHILRISVGTLDVQRNRRRIES